MHLYSTSLQCDYKNKHSLLLFGDQIGRLSNMFPNTQHNLYILVANKIKVQEIVRIQ